jgi:hypothetical protein
MIQALDLDLQKGAVRRVHPTFISAFFEDIHVEVVPKWWDTTMQMGKITDG